MDFSVDSYANHLLQDLQRQRESGQFCDMTLQVAGKSIPAHKCVLISASDYFRTLFSSSFSDCKTTTCNLPHMSYDIAEKVVSFMYDGKINISFDNVHEILRIGDFLCMKSLKDFCSKLLKTCLTDETCLCVKLLTDQYSLTDISSEVLEYVAPRFAEILNSNEALDLSIATVISLLQDNRLSYIDESSIYQFLIKWINYDKIRREQYLQDCISLLDFNFLTTDFIKRTMLSDPLIDSFLSSNGSLHASVQMRLDEESPSLRHLEDVFICRSRTVKMCEEVKLLFYLPKYDRWLDLKEDPEPHCWDGLESMVHHLGCLYFLVSKTEDMYGYMHHADETKHFWMLNMRGKNWSRLNSPEAVTGQCRLVSHINGLFVIDRHGNVEEFDVQDSCWRTVGRQGFTEDPNATMYLLPMPVDRYIYILRAFTAGYSYRYARMSFSLHTFDTVRHTWEILSDIEAEDLNLDDHERLHGYTFSPGYITFKNELGLPRVVYDTTNRNWSSVNRQVVLPSFVKDVWGSVSLRTRVYFVGRMAQERPMFLFYDHEKCRFKSVSPPKTFLSGLLCHVLAPTDKISLMAMPK